MRVTVVFSLALVVPVVVAQQPDKLDSEKVVTALFAKHRGLMTEDLTWVKAADKDKVKKLLKEGDEALTGLTASLKKRPIGKDEPLYAKSLQASLDALKQIQSGDVKSDQQVKMYAGVVADLQTKAAFEAKNSKEERRLLKVTAATKRAGAEVTGLQVWYVPRGWDGTGQHEEKFPNNSSPSAHTLPPGAYMMWTRDPDDKDKVGEKTPVSVGENGAAETNTDLPAPPK